MSELGKTIGPGFDVVSLIGTGQYGKVFLATRDGNEYAVKFTAISEWRIYAMLGLVRDDATDLPLPTVVHYGTHVTLGPYTVMPAAGETFFDQHDELCASEVLFVVHEVLRALEFLGGKCGVAHRDIKAENICIDASGRVRLVDLGSVKVCDMNAQMPDAPQISREKTSFLAPCDAHLDIPCTPRYDTEMLAINIVMWTGGVLPWLRAYAGADGAVDIRALNAATLKAKRIYIVPLESMAAKKMELLMRDSLEDPKAVRGKFDYTKIGRLCGMLVSCRHNRLPDYERLREFVREMSSQS